MQHKMDFSVQLVVPGPGPVWALLCGVDTCLHVPSPNCSPDARNSKTSNYQFEVVLRVCVYVSSCVLLEVHTATVLTPSDGASGSSHIVVALENQTNACSGGRTGQNMNFWSM
jgi:hypothetical protein